MLMRMRSHGSASGKTDLARVSCWTEDAIGDPDCGLTRLPINLLKLCVELHNQLRHSLNTI